VRRFVLSCICLVACSQPKPAQDPLDYLRVGVDPRAEAQAVIDDLRAHRFEIGRRIEEGDFVAFDAVRGAESTVRIVTSRGPSLSIHVPDLRWPERLGVHLGPDPRPDFDRDGRHDVVIAIRERERTCLAWVQVDLDGFVSDVFRPLPDWGDRPCVIEVDPSWPRVLLEVSVPGDRSDEARVRFPVKATARSWALDDSPSAAPQWEREIQRRKQGIEEAEAGGDVRLAGRLQTEVAWLEQLRNEKTPVLEAQGDGEEAR